jgi:hypothetical protein
VVEGMEVLVVLVVEAAAGWVVTCNHHVVRCYGVTRRPSRSSTRLPPCASPSCPASATTTVPGLPNSIMLTRRSDLSGPMMAAVSGPPEEYVGISSLAFCWRFADMPRIGQHLETPLERSRSELQRDALMMVGLRCCSAVRS